MDFDRMPLIVTDGFDFYEKNVHRVFDPARLYAQVLKTRSNDRVIKVERRPEIGVLWRFARSGSPAEKTETRIVKSIVLERSQIVFHM